MNKEQSNNNHQQFPHWKERRAEANQDNNRDVFNSNQKANNFFQRNNEQYFQRNNQNEINNKNYANLENTLFRKQQSQSQWNNDNNISKPKMFERNDKMSPRRGTQEYENDERAFANLESTLFRNQMKQQGRNVFPLQRKKVFKRENASNTDKRPTNEDIVLKKIMKQNVANTSNSDNKLPNEHNKSNDVRSPHHLPRLAGLYKYKRRAKEALNWKGCVDPTNPDPEHNKVQIGKRTTICIVVSIIFITFI